MPFIHHEFVIYEQRIKKNALLRRLPRLDGQFDLWICTREKIFGYRIRLYARLSCADMRNDAVGVDGVNARGETEIKFSEIT